MNGVVQASLPDSLRTGPRYYYRRPIVRPRIEPIAPVSPFNSAAGKVKKQ